MFTGRIGRLKFFGLIALAWAVMAVGAAVFAFTIMVANESASALAFPTWLVVACAYLLISLSAWIRRFHDLDQSGWMALLCFVPVVNLLALLLLIFAPGTRGPNRYGVQPGAALVPDSPPPYVPRTPVARPPYAERASEAPAAEDSPFQVMVQGLDRDFGPNNSPEWVPVGSMTGSEFARRASSLGPPDPRAYVPNAVFDREGVRLVLYQEDASVWHAMDPPPGMTDRVAVHQIPEWLEAGVTYAKRA